MIHLLSLNWYLLGGGGGGIKFGTPQKKKILVPFRGGLQIFQRAPPTLL